MKRNLFSAQVSSLSSVLRSVGVLFLISFLLVVYLSPFFGVKDDFIARADYLSYYTGGRMLWEGKGNLLYNLEEQYSLQLGLISPFSSSRPHPFKALPFVGLLLMPFSLFPFFLSYKLYVGFLLLLLGVVLFLVYRLFPNVGRFRLWFVLPFVSYAVVQAVLLGQLSIILLLIWLVLYLSLRTKRSMLAGVCCGLLLFKPPYLLALPFIFLLAGDRRKFLFGFLISFIMLLVVSWLLVGWETLAYYPSFILGTENVTYGVPLLYLFSFVSTILFLLSFSSSYFSWVLFINFLAYFGFLFMFIKQYKKIGLGRSFMVAMLLVLAFGVHMLLHDLSLLVIPVILLIDLKFGKKKEKVSYGMLIAAVLMFLPLVVFIPANFVGSLVFISVSLWMLYSDYVLKYVKSK